MNNQPLKLSLKHIGNLVLEFDGKIASVSKHIEKLKHTNIIIAGIDEVNLIPISEIKLKWEGYEALIMASIASIDDFITVVRQLFPSSGDIHTVYGTLTGIMQEPDEIVLSYGDKLQNLVLKIKELKKLKADVTSQAVEAFKIIINNDALRSFKNGLRQEIRLEFEAYN